MARAYGELCLYDRQVPILDSAIDDATRRTGAGSIETLSAVSRLSSAEMRRGRYAVARDLAERAVAGFDAAGPAGRLELARALSQAANCYRELGDLRRASTNLERSLAVRETLPEQKPEDLVGILNNAAILRWRLGELEAARPLYQRCRPGGGDPRRRPSQRRSIRSTTYYHGVVANQRDTARDLHRRVLALRRRCWRPSTRHARAEQWWTWRRMRVCRVRGSSPSAGRYHRAAPAHATTESNPHAPCALRTRSPTCRAR
jgi:tetratricopeptide (TPR) repeat protein